MGWDGLCGWVGGWVDGRSKVSTHCLRAMQLLCGSQPAGGSLGVC